jgi:prolyl oligopeptidase
MTNQENDPHLWLEERNGIEATAWAQTQSALARNLFEADPRFKKLAADFYDILADADKVPAVQLRNGFAYNLWQDETHKRGLWRRTTLESYKSAKPDWELLINMDELALLEAEPWVFHGSFQLPEGDRTLIYLSRNGQDACEVREFNLTTKNFVTDGFRMVESKGYLGWFDQDHLLVGPTLEESQCTKSGYSRQCWLWKRGEDFSQSKLLYESSIHDVSVFSNSFHDGAKKYFVVSRFQNYDTMETFLFGDDFSLKKFPVPSNASPLLIHQGHFVFNLKKPWRGFESGVVLSAPLSSVGLDEIPFADLRVVFRPDSRSALADVASTASTFYLQINENVRGKIYEARFEADGTWSLLPSFPEDDNSYEILSVDADQDTAIFAAEGFLQPRGHLLKKNGKVSPIKTAPAYFDAGDKVTEQFWIKSKDGTEVPYFVVRPREMKYDGNNPTLLGGYGGFEISRKPTYAALMGKAWLEPNAVYVLANIRGGGEFGAQWHRAAILENKQKSYDDFIAIAEDLIARKITSPSHLGIQGGSNGGLLVAAVAMQRPELFSAVICQIPLLDMIRYVDLPPGASWAAEYGDPADLKMREVILKYSPYHNVSKDKKYPKIFFQTTQADDRVHPGHARKMFARMKDFGHDVLLIESIDGGHGGGGIHLEDQARTSAYLYIYLYQQLMD